MLSRPTRPTQRHVAVKILMPMRRIIKTHKGQCVVKGDSHAADDADSDDNVDDIGEDIDVDDEGDQNAGGAREALERSQVLLPVSVGYGGGAVRVAKEKTSQELRKLPVTSYLETQV